MPMRSETGGVHSHVMGDKQKGGAHLPLDLADHRQYVALHNDVECRGRLVGDDEFRCQDGGERYRHALAHAAGQFVGIGIEQLRIQLQPLQMTGRP